ncbi:uncharacterized protein LOC105786875 [Gossypium raimondii]|uniref:uncharacterized protein LOC105786875 n=1 Tax=Gossypium raimondii TaxID=29730 RepID=UPI00063AC36F|nr:uncharacterized protein LOC105786875 [Gossypium raimondii]
MEEYLQVIPSELEIIKQDFEKSNLELEKKIERLEEEKMHLRLDADVQKLEAEKLRKGNKIREEKGKADRWEKKCQETQLQNEALERNLLESRSETDELKERIAELERSLHRYRNRNTAVELRASLSKIEEIKKRVEELEVTLQDYEMRVEFFEANEERLKEQLHYYQSQVRDRDHVMGEVGAQI